jgi:hypothetical protein
MLSALIPDLLADPDFELPERVASRFFNSEIVQASIKDVRLVDARTYPFWAIVGLRRS